MAQVPADMMLLSLVVSANKEGAADTFSCLTSQPRETKQQLVKNIPAMSSCQVIQQTLAILAAYLGDKADYWAYVDGLHKPALACRKDGQPQLYQIKNQMQK